MKSQIQKKKERMVELRKTLKKLLGIKILILL